MTGVLLPLPTTTFRNQPFEPARTPADFTKREQHADPDETLVLKEKAMKAHHDLLVELHALLQKNGWTHINEGPGAIVLWAHSPGGGPRVIFEAKTLGRHEVHQTRAALAQLFEYRHEHGSKEDELCLVVNRRLSNKRERLLAALGISVIWHDGLRFSTSHGASKTWLTKIVGAR
ncbi:hypothetical protein [Myxococcus virescens]|nr:hypothetical protein [Myxococcus virescens]